MILVSYGQLYIKMFQLFSNTWKWNSFAVGDIGQVKISGVYYVNWNMVLSERSVVLLWLGKEVPFLIFK
jgi:hypothetical protein